MPCVEFDSQAEADLANIHDYIGVQRQSPVDAERFVRRLVTKLDAYAHQPEMGEVRSELGDEIRSFTFEKTYVVIYHPLDDGIHVLRVFHGARNYVGRFLRGEP